MTQITNLFELGQLSEASYANLSDAIYRQDNLIAELQNADFNGMKFSATQAAEFAANWQVVSHQANTNSGFSATLFKHIGNDPNSGYTSGELVYAIRGTELLFNPDLFNADISDIVVDGLALDQIVDMHND